MKKINLMDIMESLNNDNHEDAAAALHEWFVDQSKTVQAKLSGQVVESEEEAEEETVEEAVETDDEDKEEVSESEESEDEETVEEARVDELSTDTMKAYAKKARMRRDRDSASDEEVGRRVSGLKMVADKARAEKAKPQYESEEADEDEGLEEALMAELSEAFKGLETVTDKLQNVEGAQVGEQGKVPVNTKDTVPHHKGADRIAGEPVEIKSNGHKGHDLEKAPKVVDVKVKGNVQNGKEEPKKVADKGDAGALLNKMDGTVNTQSPISGKGAKGLKK